MGRTKRARRFEMRRLKMRITQAPRKIPIFIARVTFLRMPEDIVLRDVLLCMRGKKGKTEDGFVWRAIM